MAASPRPLPPPATNTLAGPTSAPDRVRWAQQTLAALRHLTPAELEVIQLSYFERMTGDEIARRLGLPVAKVKTLAANALQGVADSIEGRTSAGSA